MDETDSVSGSDGGEAEGLSQEAPADASRSHQQDVLMLGDEVHGEGGVDEPTVEGDFSCPVAERAISAVLEPGRWSWNHPGLITAESRAHNAAQRRCLGSASERGDGTATFALSGVDIPSGPLKLIGNGAVDLG